MWGRARRVFLRTFIADHPEGMAGPDAGETDHGTAQDHFGDDNFGDDNFA